MRQDQDCEGCEGLCESGVTQLRAIIESVPDAVVIVDEGGRIRWFSPAAERMFGYDAEAVVGGPVERLMPPENAAFSSTHLSRYRDTNDRQLVGTTSITTGRRADGALFPAEFTLGEADAPCGRLFTAFVRDISERVSAQQRLDALRSAYAKSARMSVKDETAAGIAHEINQPLAAGANYLGAAELMVRDGHAGADVSAMLHAARGQLLRAGEIIRGLRAFLPVDRTALSAQPVAQVFEDAVGLAFVGDPRAARVERRIADGAAYMLADPVQVQQVLVNLLRNAVRAVAALPEPRRQIVLAARPVDGGKLEIRVSDSGAGLPDAVLERLHAPFLASEADGGLAIGLSICRRIVEAHGGTLRAGNEPGGGASIAFTLPAGPAPHRPTEA